MSAVLANAHNFSVSDESEVCAQSRVFSWWAVISDTSEKTAAEVSRARRLAKLRKLGSVPLSRFLADHPIKTSEEYEARRPVEREVLKAVEAGTISLLTARRVLAGMTQAELARTLGLSQPQVARWEKNDHFEQITLANLRKLALALRISPAALVEV